MSRSKRANQTGLKGTGRRRGGGLDEWVAGDHREGIEPKEAVVGEKSLLLFGLGWLPIWSSGIKETGRTQDTKQSQGSDGGKEGRVKEHRTKTERLA